MTRSEISALKQDFIEKRQDTLKRKMSALEKKLYEAILDQFINELSQSDGIIDSSGKNIKLTTAIDKVFKDFKSDEYTKVILGFGKDLSNITDLNRKYFKVAIDDYDLNKYDKISSEVESFMSKRIGITNDGNIQKKSYLDRLLSDEALKNKIKDMTMKAITNKKPVSELIKEMETIIIGNENVDGGLQKYFNQYMRDAYTQFDRTTGKLYAEKLGMKCFIYQGGKRKNSRDMCKKNDGKVFTIEEAQKWKGMIGNDNGPIWSKDLGEYQPIVDMGGINCYHSADFISNSLAKRLRPDLKDKL